MKRARVTWTNGVTEVLPVIRETSHSFTTADRNQSTWWKRPPSLRGAPGTRIGALTHTAKKPNGFTDYAIARLLKGEERDRSC